MHDLLILGLTTSFIVLLAAENATARDACWYYAGAVGGLAVYGLWRDRRG